MEDHGGLRIPAPPRFVSPRSRAPKINKEVLPPLYLGKKVASPAYSPKRAVMREVSPMRNGSPKMSPKLLPKGAGSPSPSSGNVGFEAISAAMHKLIENLGGEDSLDKKWLQVSRYLDNYASDAERTSYVTTLTQIFERTDLSANATATISCLDRLFLLLTLYIPSCASLVTTLRARLGSLVFAQPPDCSMHPLPFEVETATRDELYHSLTTGGSGVTHKDALNSVKMQDEEAEGKKKEVEALRRRRQAEAVDMMLKNIEKKNATTVLRLWRAGMRNRKTIRSLERQLEAREQFKNSLERKLSDAQCVIRKLKDEIRGLSKTIEDAALQDERNLEMSVSLRVEKDEMSEYQEQLSKQNSSLKRQIVELNEAHESLLTTKNRSITHLSANLKDAINMVRGREDCLTTCTDIVEYIENYAPSVALCDDKSLSKFVLNWMHLVYAKRYDVRRTNSRNDIFHNPTKELKYMYTALAYVSPWAVPEVDLEDIEDSDTASDFLEYCREAGVDTTSITADQLLTNAQSRLFVSCQILLRGLQIEKNTSGPESASDGGQVEWRTVLKKTRSVLKQRDGAATTLSELMNKSFVTAHFFDEDEGILSLEEQMDKRRFSFNPDTSKLTDLFVATGEDANTGLRGVNDVLTDNYKRLRNIYRYYSSSDSAVDITLTRSELSQFLKDCKCGDIERPKKRKANSSSGQLLQPEIFKDIQIKEKGELSVEEWVQVIVRTAAYKAKGATLSYKLTNFLAMHVIPNANYVAVDEFKAELRKPHIQQVLQEAKPFLLKVFGYYSSLEADSNKREVSWKEFKRLMDDIRAVDEVCTHYAIMQIFIKLQPETFSAAVDELGMPYADFVIAIAAVAAFKNPAPYLPLHNKIRRFVQVWMVQPLGKKIKSDL